MSKRWAMAFEHLNPYIEKKLEANKHKTENISEVCLEECHSLFYEETREVMDALYNWHEDSSKLEDALLEIADLVIALNILALKIKREK